MKCLWLAREMPFPLLAGDRIYSRGLAGALAQAGAEVVFTGLAGAGEPQQATGIAWHVVPGGERMRLGAVLSPLPLVAARHATRAYRSAIKRLLAQEAWDAVIIDHYGMAWALDELSNSQAVRVMVAHNHEAGVTQAQWRDRSRKLPTRLYLWQNWLKTRRLENRAARTCDLITTITDADARRFDASAPAARVIVATPGYAGRTLAMRTISEATPRSVIMFESYRWSAKRASLQILLDSADPVLAAAGVALHVVGDMDEAFRAAMAKRYPSAQFHGFVDDPTPYLRSARMSLLSEPVGGGFKLKLLEYLFQRVPVAALRACVAGLPDAISAEMILASDIDTLLARVVAEIDDVAALDGRQSRAYALAAGAFDWADRGRHMLDAIRSARSRRDWPAARQNAPALALRADPLQAAARTRAG